MYKNIHQNKNGSSIKPVHEIWYFYGQGTKIFQYCTCPAGLVTYNFHLSCKHMHLSFEIVCNKEHKGVICNMTSSSSSFQSTRPTVEFLSPVWHTQKYSTRPQDQSVKLKLNFLISDTKHVVGTQKNCLNEMVLLSTQNTC